ncbi:MFS transporter [Bradyrhizobium sp.]|uniref:MFS transporter n=1 Tax=Bradyrhizobium sp. TaxID=376 RepID=UPI0039E25C15
MRPTSPIGLVCLAVFFGLAAMGLPLPVLPPYLVGRFGFEIDAVGLVMAAQSAATLLSRLWAGRLVDRRGPRRAVAIGLTSMLLASIAYGLATLGIAANTVDIALILVGRVLTGIGEGLVITGGGAWAVGLVGVSRAGWAMSWIGLAMFGGLALGAGAGALFEFHAAVTIMAAVSIAGLLIAGRAQAIEVQTIAKRTPMMQIVTIVWWPGLTLALSVFGLAAVSSFGVLLFNDKGWPNGGMAVALFGFGHVAARLFLSRLPDRTHTILPMLVLILLEGAGILMIATASVPAFAFMGAALAGFGFSMVFPMMAVPMLRGIPESARGTAIGIYDAFFDIAMGAAAVTCGWMAQRWGLPFAFYGAAIAVVASIASAVKAAGSRKQ